MGFMCLFLRVALHQSMIRAEQFCKGAHQELSGERRGQEWSVRGRRHEPGLIQEQLGAGEGGWRVLKGKSLAQQRR